MVDKAVDGSEIVYLVVGLDYNVNVWEERWPKLMRATIDACIKHKSRLVFFDNVYMYDIHSIHHMTEKSAINPPSRKGAVRKQIAQMLMDEVRTGRMMALIARSADFYGPASMKTFVNEVIINNFKKGRSASWFMSADKLHSFTFTPDATKATALLGNTNDAYNQVWHLPTCKDTLTGRQFIQLFAREMNAIGKVSVIPLWFIKILGLFIPLMKEMPEMMYQYDRDYFFDSSKFESKFNLTPTSYEEGVRLTVKQSGT